MFRTLKDTIKRVVALWHKNKLFSSQDMVQILAVCKSASGSDVDLDVSASDSSKPHKGMCGKISFTFVSRCFCTVLN
jgi:hypothetical protein